MMFALFQKTTSSGWPAVLHVCNVLCASVYHLESSQPDDAIETHLNKELNTLLHSYMNIYVS